MNWLDVMRRDCVSLGECMCIKDLGHGLNVIWYRPMEVAG